ncbi:copper resistance protein NlpE [Capnocytophaga catalasegens]|uniref:Copper resistance protein n=1 Tax=Capnocytophaga catalasegens TaxID=1004260 RepID=A0AAV5AXM8_9FLAO|nr:copper resistance protein NlpE [Capnocytophaga catalasegens]GIZ14357.1 copper resistance protein [Capnocytophaga catalasegens]GJM51354.1 copper resistance protein [Capnocytophaga catalasegens]GJM53229.1 copper resistance protein [Capnocytophaga catalasegens]
MKRVILTVTGLILFASCNNNPKQTTSTTTETATQQEMTQPDTHTSQNSLDWAGTYKGTIPAASSSGIEVTLELMNDNTYKKKEVYLDEKDGTFNEEGTFTWSSDGSKITLKSQKGDTQLYKLIEGGVILLDADGNEITGELASHYILKKAN